MTTLKTIEVPRIQVIAKLKELRLTYPTTRTYPFLIGGKEDLDHLMDLEEYWEAGPDEILATAANIDIPAWFNERRNELGENGYDENELLGEWPDESSIPGDPWQNIYAFKRILTPTVVLGVMELGQPWQLPAAMHYGGWNECPDAETQCAMFKIWQERYGAEIVAMSGDTIECVVSRPPKTKGEAMELAWQQFLFCEDIVTQGTESVAALAAGLLNSGLWFFWWD